MKVLHMPQGSIEWFEARRGRPSASQFKRFITAEKGEFSQNKAKNGPSEACLGYIAELIAELGDPNRSLVPDKFVSKAMLNGIAMEPEARSWFELQTGCDVQQVGVCLTDDGRFAASPDFMCDPDGTGELKCPEPATHVFWTLQGILPPEHKVQVHSQLWVTGRKYAEFMSYCPPFPPFMVKVYPDEFTRKIGAAADQFWGWYSLYWDKFFPGRELKLAA
jgi:hypothetical protein